MMARVRCTSCGAERPTTAPAIFDGAACPDNCGGVVVVVDDVERLQLDEKTARMALYPTTGRRVEHRGRHIP